MATPGEKLRAARESRSLTIKQATQATRIRAHYIEAMEADDLSVMPSAVQARGFLRAYAEFLGLDFNELAQPNDQPQPQIVAEAIPEPEPEPEPELDFEQSPEPQPEPATPSNPEDDAETFPEPAREMQPSNIIFRQIGESLRQRRELLGLTLDEIERHTRVRRANLRSIEQGDFEGLASPVQARGMLNSYANFLDMNGEAMLLRFAEGLQARRAERQVALPAPRKRWGLSLWVRRLISPDLIFGTLIILSITAMLVWGATRIIASQEIEQQESEAPSISDVLLASPEGQTETPQALPTSIEELGTPLPALDDTAVAPVEDSAPDSPPPGSILQVTLIIRERVFLRVTVDGEIQQDGRVAPGAALTFDGRERIEVLTGNGNAVQVIYNQFDFGAMGNPGEVANRIYTLDGVQTPTPTIAPTATNTPLFQPSETPTVTPTSTLSELP